MRSGARLQIGTMMLIGRRRDEAAENAVHAKQRMMTSSVVKLDEIFVSNSYLQMRHHGVCRHVVQVYATSSKRPPRKLVTRAPFDRLRVDLTRFPGQ